MCDKWIVKVGIVGETHAPMIVDTKEKGVIINQAIEGEILPKNVDPENVSLHEFTPYTEDGWVAAQKSHDLAIWGDNVLNSPGYRNPCGQERD